MSTTSSDYPTTPLSESQKQPSGPVTPKSAWGRLFRQNSIRSTLLTSFLLLVLLPALAVGIGGGITAWRNGQQQTINQLNSVMAVKESDIATWLNSLRTNLAIMLPSQEVGDLALTLVNPEAEATAAQAAHEKLFGHLTWMVEKSELYDEVFLMDTHGRVVLSTEPLEEHKVHINQPYFAKGLENFYFSPPFYSPSLGRLSIVAVRPLTDQSGQVVGVLAGRASTKKLSEIMQLSTGLGQTGVTYLVGPNYALLTDAKGHTVTELIYLRSAAGVATAISTKGKTDGLFTDFVGISVIGAYHWFPDLQVALVAEQDQTEAFASTYAILLINLSVSVIAVVIAILVGMLVTSSIANPLAKLAEAASAIEVGRKLDPEGLSMVVTRSDELGQFGRIFQSMVREIYNREEKLKRQVAEMRIEIDQAKKEKAVSEITESEFFQSLTEKAKDLRSHRRALPKE